jgi:hypothetical protein
MIFKLTTNVTFAELSCEGANVTIYFGLDTDDVEDCFVDDVVIHEVEVGDTDPQRMAAVEHIFVYWEDLVDWQEVVDAYYEELSV